MKELREYLMQHEERWIDELHPLSDKPERLLGQNGLVILQRLLGRSLSLTNSIEKAYKQKNIISFSIAIRAHFETVGVLALIYKKFCDFYDSKCTLEDLDEQLLKGFLGSKIKNDTLEFQSPDPLHVSTAIKKVDIYLKSIGGEHEYFKEGYDLLCEFTHPNFLGTSFCTTVDDGFVYFLNLKDSYAKYEKSITPQFHISQIAFFHLYDEFLQKLSGNEQLPLIIKDSKSPRKFNVPIYVKESKVFHTGMTDGVVKIKHAYLTDMQCSHHDFSKLRSEVRSLLRCRDNLKMVHFDLVCFITKYYGDNDDPKMSFDLEPRAILSHCLMNYRACFVVGEAEQKPLGFLNQSFEQEVIHIKIRKLSDKLIGHLDVDSEVRTDTIHWDFEVTDKGLIPISPQNLFSKILSLHRNEILEWQDHISKILLEIERRIGEISHVINSNIHFVP